MEKLTEKLATLGKRNKVCTVPAQLCIFFLYIFGAILEGAKLSYKALRGTTGRRIAAAALSACMVFTLLPMAAFATEGETATTGGETTTAEGETATAGGETATAEGETATAEGETATIPGASGIVTKLLITGFAPLAEEIRTQRVGADDLVLPKTLLATVDAKEIEIPVTWDGLDAVNEARKSGGFCVLTANAGEGYQLAEGITAPTISAMIVGMGRILGAGTAAKPLELRTEGQLREIAALTNAGTLSSTVFGPGKTDMVYIKLMNDLDISGSEWTPIGIDANKFNGSFDGGGHTITGLTINQPTMNSVGLFGYATGDIKNLGVINVSVVGKDYVGGVAGNAGGAVTGCYSTGSITGFGNVGGVVGSADGTVSNCYSTATVMGSARRVGGVVGGVSEGASMANCYATGAVSGDTYVGGVVGKASSSISGCYSTGSITGANYVGGVVGDVDNEVSSCVALNPAITATGSNVGRVAVNGRISGSAAFADTTVNGTTVTSGMATNKNGANITNLATLDGKFNDTAFWNTFTAETLPTLKDVGQQTLGRPAYLMATPFTGTGTRVDPYQIATAEQLRELGRLTNIGDTTYNDFGKYFKLTANLDISGSEWTPIGTIANKFAASFDGGGHTVTGLTINQTTMDYVGLFGYAAGAIQNLGVINVSVVGKSAVGGVTGSAAAPVSNGYSTGSVTGTINVGGVVGIAFGTAPVSNCYSTATVSGNSSSSSSTDGIGGVAGTVKTITNCVALNPAVTNRSGTLNVGRVAGSIDSSGGSASGCSAFRGMTVNGSTATSGTATDKNGENITNLVTFDGKFTSDGGWSAFTGETLPTFKSTETTSTLARPAYLRPISFNGAGTAGDPYQISTADQLRYLGMLVNTGDATYSASSKYYKLTADLDISGSQWTPIGTSANQFYAKFDGGGHTITGLTINQPTMNYVGLFGYTATIQNLGVINVDVTGKNNVSGVAGNSNSAITNCYVTGTVTGDNYVGGVAGYAGGAITNCYATATVSGNSSSSSSTDGIGGVAGTVKTITNCVALNPAVTNRSGTLNVGRVAGSIDSSGSGVSGCAAFRGMTVNGSTATGGMENNKDGANITNLVTFDGKFTSAGGWSAFTGETLPTFKSTETTSTLARPAYLLATPFNGAGTAGDPYQISTADQLRHLGMLVNTGDATYSASSKYYKLTADLDISGSQWTPIGTYLNANKFKGSFDGGGHTITGLTINQPTMDYVGLFGCTNDDATIQNLGVINVDVTGKNYVSGVAGNSNSAITNCYVTGTVTGDKYVGGVVGFGSSSGAAITNCYSTATVTGTANAIGGVVGGAICAVTNCYATGNVTGTSRVGGVVGVANGTTSNCVALNPSITATDSSPSVGRVAGDIGSNGSVSGCSAFAGMTVNGAPVTGGTATDKNGADATKANLEKASWWKTTASFPEASWALADNNLPALKTTGGTVMPGQKTDLPVFLTEFSTRLTAAERLVNELNGMQSGTAALDGTDKNKVNLLKNVTLTSTITIAGDLTLDTKTYTITGAAGSGSGSDAITITTPAKVTITGSLGGGIIGGAGSSGSSTGVGASGGTGVKGAVTLSGSVSITGGAGGNNSGTGSGGSTGGVGGIGVHGNPTLSGSAEATGGGGGNGGFGVFGNATLGGSAKATGGNCGTGGGSTGGIGVYGNVTLSGSATATGGMGSSTREKAIDGGTITAETTDTIILGGDSNSAITNVITSGTTSSYPYIKAQTAYAITKAGTTGGSFTVKVGTNEVTQAVAGSTVTITPTPDTGNVVDAVSVTKTGASDPVTVTNNTFTMPAYPVTVSVSFKAGGGTHKPVSDITGIPTAATASVPLLLTGTVNPADATNKTIVWSVKNAGTTGATITGSTLSTTAAGTVVVTATIANGASATADYTQDTTITVSATPVTDTEKIAAVKAAIESVLSNLSVSNATTAQDILNAANSAASLGVTVAWDSVNGFAKTNATAGATGSITGSLKLTLNSETATVALNMTIPKLTAATYTVTLDANGGTVSPTSLSVAAGGTAALPTPTRSDSYRFEGWFTAQSGGTQYTAATPITSDVTLYAHWTYTGGSGGGSSGDSDSSFGGSLGGKTTVTPSAPNKPNTPTQQEIKISGKVDENGNATATLTNKQVSDAIKQAEDTARKNGTLKNGIKLVLNVDTGSTVATSVSVNLPRVTQETILNKKIISTVLVVNNPDIQIGIDLAAVKEINAQAKADVNISATRMDNKKLTGEAKTAIGSRPVFDLKATYQNGSKSVTSFGGGLVSVVLPYTLQAGEVAGGLYAVYVGAGGKASYITNSSYDAHNKVLRFATNHFSLYGIGYKAPARFTDIANHWAKADIQFVASRGLMNGTTNTTFAPGDAMTRGMFVAALGKLAGIDSTKYTSTKFTDVSATAYYAPYVAWATKMGIADGTGATTFSPDNIVTRQEMAVLMSRYAKAMNYKAPATREAITFADNSAIGSGAAAAVKQVQMAGVICGKNGNKFDPTGTATRGEVAAVLHRYLELVIDPATAQGPDTNDSGSALLYQNGRLVKS